MTTTSNATPVLPGPRTVLHLRPGSDIDRRPAGRHLVPDELLLDDHGWWDRELEAQFQGRAHRRPLAEHGRRCGCCTPPPAVEAVS